MGEPLWAGELTAQLSAPLLTSAATAHLVATDYCSGVTLWLGGVAGEPTLLTTQVGWWVLSPCTVSVAYSVLLQGLAGG